MQNLDQGEQGRSKVERAYRQWCLDKRLFLCPLNDLGPYLAAATDDLMLPGIRERFDERPGDYSPPPIIGFFSQMKQEYVSARYMLFEGIVAHGSISPIVGSRSLIRSITRSTHLRARECAQHFVLHIPYSTRLHF